MLEDDSCQSGARNIAFYTLNCSVRLFAHQINLSMRCTWEGLSRAIRIEVPTLEQPRCMRNEVAPRYPLWD
jgi:hypothetical protein